MSSQIDKDFLVSNFPNKIKALTRRISTLEISHPGSPGTQPGQLPYFDEEGIVDMASGGPRLYMSTDNVTEPPTQAELTSVLGRTPEEMGAGFTWYIWDNGANTARLIMSDGDDWRGVALTKY